MSFSRPPIFYYQEPSPSATSSCAWWAKWRNYRHPSLTRLFIPCCLKTSAITLSGIHYFVLPMLILVRWVAGRRKGLRFAIVVPRSLRSHRVHGYPRKEPMDHQLSNLLDNENLALSLPLWIAHSKISKSQPTSLLSWFLWDPTHRDLSISISTTIDCQVARNPYLQLIYSSPQCISQIDFWEKDYSWLLPRS